MKVTIELPMPPSTNNLFFNTARGRHITKAYKDWKVEAGWAILEQKPTCFHSADVYPVSVTIHVYGGKGLSCTRDGDNCFKAPIDLLKTQDILLDDTFQYVQEHHSYYYPAKDKSHPARFLIEIETIQEIEGRQEMKQIAEEIALLADQAAKALKNGEYEKSGELMSQMIALQKQMNSELKAKETE